MTVKVLGISGSPRHGNTDIMVQETLKGAESLGDVEIDFVSIPDYKIKAGCISCYKCKGTNFDEMCRGVKDDANIIFKKMVGADAIIVGSPVYWGGITGQLKCLLDRTMALEHVGMVLRNKVLGAVTTAADRNGGHEGTIIEIHRWGLIHDMVVVGCGPERFAPSCGCYWGVAALRGYPDPVSSSDPGSLSAVKQDHIGITQCKYLGLRVAEMAHVMKTGFAAKGVKTNWPAKGIPYVDGHSQ